MSAFSINGAVILSHFNVCAHRRSPVVTLSGNQTLYSFRFVPSSPRFRLPFFPQPLSQSPPARGHHRKYRAFPLSRDNFPSTAAETSGKDKGGESHLLISPAWEGRTIAGQEGERSGVLTLEVSPEFCRDKSRDGESRVKGDAEEGD